MAKRWLAALPVFNEVGAVGGVLDEVRRYANHILTVDDGSTDATPERLQEIVARDRRVVVVQFRRNYGQTAAMQAGLEQARGEY
ncbi:MAG: glycosyltransferase, partial [Pirellulaceae bacterium]